MCLSHFVRWPLTCPLPPFPFSFSMHRQLPVPRTGRPRLRGQRRRPLHHRPRRQYQPQSPCRRTISSSGRGGPGPSGLGAGQAAASATGGSVPRGHVGRARRSVRGGCSCLCYAALSLFALIALCAVSLLTPFLSPDVFSHFAFLRFLRLSFHLISSHRIASHRIASHRIALCRSWMGTLQRWKPPWLRSERPSSPSTR